MTILSTRSTCGREKDALDKAHVSFTQFLYLVVHAFSFLAIILQ